ncbi:MAG: adenylate/guanylate cyclase domain-containing protein [Flavobacteriaceae bacterium]
MTNAIHLSAILFCDIEGYTALMQKDEANTMLLLDKYERTLTGMMEKYGGEIIKNYGDGSICLFKSAVQMVQCAIEVQQALRVPPIVPLRIGLNLGDVHRKADDVYGDAVNIASRIEDIGIGGNVLLTHSLYQKVKNHPEFEFRSLGKFYFKNVDEAHEVFAVANEGVVVPKRKQLVGKFKKKEIKIKGVWFLIILVLATAFYLVQKNFQGATKILAKGEIDKIAVLEFDNYTGDDRFDITGKMAVDWIIHGITQNKMGQVISPKNIEDYSKVLEAGLVPSANNTTVTDYLKPSKIIRGSFYLNKGRLLFQCSITDELMNETLFSFNPVECDPKSPLDCIEALKQKILGYLITEDKKGTNLQETPPNYEAYQYLLQAKLVQYKNDEEHLRLLDKAIEADSNYFEPKTYKLVYYYNSNDYVAADSLLKAYKGSIKTNERQRDLFSLYEALLTGHNGNVFVYEQKEYNYAPLDMETNSSMMTVSLQFVNKPTAVDTIYREIDMRNMDMQNCSYCEDRYYIKALADIELQKYSEAIELLSPFENENEYKKLKKVLIRAHIKLGNLAVADSLISNLQLTMKEQDWMEITLFNARDLMLQDQGKRSRFFLDKIIKAIQASPNSEDVAYQQMLAECLFLSEAYVQAQTVLGKLLRTHPDLTYHTVLLAICNQKNGEIPEAGKQLEHLESLRGAYQYGSVDYAFAQYYAAIGDENNMIKNLIRAVAAGRWYDTTSFQNDPLLQKYISTPPFNNIMNYWN